MVANLITIQLMIPICLAILSHGHSTTTSSEIYPLIHLILYLIYYYYFKKSLIFSFFKKIFFLIHDLIYNPVHDQIGSNPGFVNASTFLSTLSHDYFCIYMYCIIAARFRCWSLHFDSCTHTNNVPIEGCALLVPGYQKELSFSFRELKNIAILMSRVADCTLSTLYSSLMYDTLIV